MNFKLTAEEVEAVGKTVQVPGLKVWSDEARAAALAARRAHAGGKKPIGAGHDPSSVSHSAHDKVSNVPMPRGVAADKSRSAYHAGEKAKKDPNENNLRTAAAAHSAAADTHKRAAERSKSDKDPARQKLHERVAKLHEEASNSFTEALFKLR